MLRVDHNQIKTLRKSSKYVLNLGVIGSELQWIGTASQRYQSDPILDRVDGRFFER